MDDAADCEKQDGGRKDPAEGDALPQVGGDSVIPQRLRTGTEQQRPVFGDDPPEAERNHLRIETHSLGELGDVAVRPVQIRNRRPRACRGWGLAQELRDDPDLCRYAQHRQPRLDAVPGEERPSMASTASSATSA